jgi:hypothetical protein
MSESEGEDQKSLSGGVVKKRFHNGWTNELEDMMADWADKAACYRWMHEKTSTLYGIRDRSFNIPVIILSGVTAGANFALNSIFGENNKENQKWAQLGLGGASLIAGIIQTLMNFYGYAKGSEAHRLAGISWGKFNRQVCIEMRMHPNERQDSINFLKWFRTELDRLIEQSPIIPDAIVERFNRLFKTVDVVKPEITGILQHTRVFKDTDGRLKRLAAEATITLQYKKGVIKQLVADELERKTRIVAIDAARQIAKEILAEERAKATAAVAAVAEAAKEKQKTVLKPFVERQKEERKQELKDLTGKRSQTVAALRNKFAQQVLFGGEGSPVQLPGMTAEETRNTTHISPIVAPTETYNPSSGESTKSSGSIGSTTEITVEQTNPNDVGVQILPTVNTNSPVGPPTAEFMTPAGGSAPESPKESGEEADGETHVVVLPGSSEEIVQSDETNKLLTQEPLPEAPETRSTFDDETVQEQQKTQEEEEEQPKSKGWLW